MSKFSKFVEVDPLGGGADEEEVGIQEAMATEVNSRLEKAVDDLRQKYNERGAQAAPASEPEPTGAAYKEARADEAKRAKAAKQRRRAEADRQQGDEDELQRQLEERLDLEGSDDELLDGLDEDPEVRRMREERMRQLKAAQAERVSQLAKGHGQYRDILQDEFLPEVTSSPRVACHFYHKDFERCKIMDHHLSLLAPRHVECKFVKIDADKAPFFVEKLAVRVLPCVVLFNDGIAFDRIEGFEGLASAEAIAAGKEDGWPTAALARRLALARVINKAPGDDEGAKGSGGSNVRARAMASMIREGLQDGDLSDSDD